MDEQAERELFRSIGNMEGDLRSIKERLTRWSENCDVAHARVNLRLDTVEKGIDVKRLIAIATGVATAVASAIAAIIAFFRG